MKRLIIIASMLTVLLASAKAQTKVKLDSKGNYVTTQLSPDSLKAKDTGKTFTDRKGNVYPVMVSRLGKLFYLKTSRNGNEYKVYLKTE